MTSAAVLVSIISGECASTGVGLGALNWGYLAFNIHIHGTRIPSLDSSASETGRAVAALRALSAANGSRRSVCSVVGSAVAGIALPLPNVPAALRALSAANGSRFSVD